MAISAEYKSGRFVVSAGAIGSQFGVAFVSRRTGQFVNNGLNAYGERLTPVGHCIRFGTDLLEFCGLPFEAETREGRISRHRYLWQAVRSLIRKSRAAVGKARSLEA